MKLNNLTKMTQLISDKEDLNPRDHVFSYSILWLLRTSNQSTLKEINPEYSLEGLMLIFLYFANLM